MAGLHALIESGENIRLVRIETAADVLDVDH